MEQILQITKSNVINAFNKTDEKGKKLLEDLFGENTFKFSYTDVKSYEDACAVIDEEPVDFDVLNETLKYNGFKALSAHEIAYKKLVTIAKALNISWCPNWANFDEYKYYPCFGLEKEDTPAGVGGAHNGALLGVSVLTSNLAVSYSCAGCGGALASENREIAIYFGKQFVEIWRDYICPIR